MQLKQIHFKTIDSTNTWAKIHLEDLNKDQLTLITADEQTAGRGRWKRSWVSGNGENLIASYCFFLDTIRPDLGNIPQVLSLSAAEVLRHQGFPVLIKWPNDLILQGKKLGGILCETGMCENSIGVVVGIGINVNMDQKILESIDRPAISLYSAAGKRLMINDVLTALTAQFQIDLKNFLQNGFQNFHKKYIDLSSLKKGKPIVVNIHPQKYTGFFHSLRNDGSLIMSDPDGSLKTFHSGEILE